MVKHLSVIALGLVVITGLYAFVVPQLSRQEMHQVACTTEAKLCPDGSAVGRTGPTCEFAPCPIVLPQPVPTVESVVRGTVSLGPVCPVERNPPDPACADKPYEGDFVIANSGVSMNVRSDASGSFSVRVPPGTYTIVSISQRAYPRCETLDAVVVAPDLTTEVHITCDSGIR